MDKVSVQFNINAIGDNNKIEESPMTCHSWNHWQADLAAARDTTCSPDRVVLAESEVHPGASPDYAEDSASLWGRTRGGD